MGVGCGTRSVMWRRRGEKEVREKKGVNKDGGAMFGGGGGAEAMGL